MDKKQKVKATENFDSSDEDENNDPARESFPLK